MTTTLPTLHKSKTAHGKIFEKEFLNSFPPNMFMQRLKDDTLKYKNVQNCCDFIAYVYPNIYLLELKSTKQKSLPFGNINQHQIDVLYRFSKLNGIVSGFVINFRTYNYSTFFVSAEKMYDFYYQSGGRKSFPLEWVQENGVLLPATLMRTRYKFDLNPILQLQI